MAGEVCGPYFSLDGESFWLAMNDRMIALANIGAVRSGLLDVLVTDEETAREVLSSLESEDAALSGTENRRGYPGSRDDDVPDKGDTQED